MIARNTFTIDTESEILSREVRTMINSIFFNLVSVALMAFY